MKFLSTLLMYTAYVLIYSAVAAGGKFATEPWNALFADAYATPEPTNADFANAVGSTPFTPNPPSGVTLAPSNADFARAAGGGATPLSPTPPVRLRGGR